MQTTTDLAQFLSARIAEDEERAKGDIERFGGTDDLRDQWIVRLARRVLVECDAKRRIVRVREARAQPRPHGHGARPARGRAQVFDVVLRDLATVYADHPDYRQEWRP